MDQGTADKFLAEQLKPIDFVRACAESGLLRVRTPPHALLSSYQFPLCVAVTFALAVPWWTFSSCHSLLPPCIKHVRSLLLPLHSLAFPSPSSLRSRQVTLREQLGYDHSYYFIASFIADHINFHAQALLADSDD